MIILLIKQLLTIQAESRSSQSAFVAGLCQSQIAVHVTCRLTPSTAFHALPASGRIAARLRREGDDWTASLRDLPTPALVVHGEADLLPISEAHRAARWFAQARRVPLANAGHNPFREAPGPFFAAVHAFLAEAPPVP